MRKRNRRGLFGLGEADRASEAIKWLESALKNFNAHKGKRSCFQIEHFTDVIAEATAASAVAPQGSAIVTRASRLASEATQAQRESVHACRKQTSADTGYAYTHTPKETARIEKIRQSYKLRKS